MNLLSLIIVLCTGFFGIYLGFRSFMNFRCITRNEVSLRYLIVNSFIAGGAGFFIFVSIIIVMSFYDKAHSWTINNILGSIIFSLIPGGIISIGSFVQSIMVTKFKRGLLDSFRRDDRNKRE